MVTHTLKAGLGALGLKELHLLSRAFAESRAFAQEGKGEGGGGCEWQLEQHTSRREGQKSTEAG